MSELFRIHQATKALLNYATFGKILDKNDKHDENFLDIHLSEGEFPGPGTSEPWAHWCGRFTGTVAPDQSFSFQWFNHRRSNLLFVNKA